MKIPQVSASIGISGTFEFKDKDGNILDTMEVRGSVPLSELDLTVEQAQELITNHEGANNDTDNRK